MTSEESPHQKVSKLVCSVILVSDVCCDLFLNFQKKNTRLFIQVCLFAIWVLFVCNLVRECSQVCLRSFKLNNNTNSRGNPSVCYSGVGGDKGCTEMVNKHFVNKLAFPKLRCSTSSGSWERSWLVRRARLLARGLSGAWSSA